MKIGFLGLNHSINYQNKIIDLGIYNSNKTIDVTTIPNYQKLTVDNFIISVNSITTSLNMTNQAASLPSQYNHTNGYERGCTCSTSSTIQKEYNAESGILTVTGISSGINGFSAFNNIVPGTTGYGSVCVGGNSSCSIEYNVFLIF